MQDFRLKTVVMIALSLGFLFSQVVLPQSRYDNENAYIKKRGIKFNITFDKRTPSYDSSGDAADVNIKHMWDITFWHEFLDELALHKYNVISLWNRHPFPSMVKVADYPDVALKDVYDNQGLVKKISIEDKILFWQEVMAYAKDLGFEIYIFNWNLFVHGAEGKHGITESLSNSITQDYMRKSLYALFETYPDLDGFGLHSGENMGGINDSQKEVWLYDAFGKAFEDMKRDYPDRELRFIHRLHETDISDDIMPAWSNLPYTMDMSYKYTLGHLYCYPRPTFINSTLNDLDVYHKKVWLNIRNDDIFYYRWGDPDYVREFLKNVPDVEQYLAGYYMGSDGYVWGRVFSCKNPLFQGDLEVNKHWYHFMLWGQLGYDPDTPDQYFIDAIGDRFPGVQSRNLFDAWRFASKIFPKVSAAFWWNWDFQWYVEGCYSTYGFRTIQDFISTNPQSGAPIYSIKEYKSQLAGGRSMDKETPIEVSEALRAWADSALALSETIQAEGNTELMLTLNDIKAMSYMGYYYADKIAGATYHSLGDLEKCADHLQQAYCHWSRVAEIASAQYDDQELARHGSPDFSWNDLLDDVGRDLDLNGGLIAGHCDAQAPPEAPAVLHATGINAGTEVELTWIDHSQNENFFKIERKEERDSVFSVIGIVASNVCLYNDFSINGNTKYIYRVRASNPAGNSEYSNADTLETAAILSGQIPWIEDFSRLPDGTTEDNGRTRWQIDTSRLDNAGGTFSVQNQMFDVVDTDGDGIWISEKIDISSVADVELSVKVRSEGGLDDTGGNYDYVKCIIKIDDSEAVLVRELKGKIFNNSMSGTLIRKQNISGKTLQVFIHSTTSYSDEHYYIDDISITSSNTDVHQDETAVDPPHSFSLMQNYPNPFNQSTTIQFMIHRTCPVELSVWNVSGRLVRTLANETMLPGLKTLVWDGSDSSGRSVSTGNYFLRMKSGKRSDVAIMSLLK